jgi:PAS domain S-box-containing protein/putative nucleotidyltransferase with HDIG domain
MQERNNAGTATSLADCEMEPLYLQILEHSPDPAFMIDCSRSDKLHLAGANPAWFDLLGSPYNVEGGQALERLLNDESSSQLASHLRQCLEIGTGITYPDLLKTPNGDRHIQASLTPLRDENGRIHRVLGIVRDTTQQQQIQERFALLEFALDQAGEAAYLLDAQSRIHYVNSEACRMLGFSRNELLTMTVPDLDPNWPKECWPEIWLRVMELGSLNFETSHRAKDGHIIPVEITSCYLRHQTRDYQFALVRNITDRKRTETELHARSEEFRALVENSPDLVVRYDRSCRRVYANPVFVRLSGSTLQQFLGKKPTENQLLLGEPETYESLLKEVIETGEATEQTFSWHDINKHESWTHARFVPEWDASGQVASVLVIGHDITTLKRAERQLSTLINNIPDMVVRFDTEARQIYVNPTVCKMFAQPEESFLGHTPPGEASDGRPMEAWIRDAVNTGKPNHCEVTWQLPDGAHHYTVRHVPEMDRHGHVISVLGIATNVTALKQAENKFRTLAENLPDVVIRYDLECRRTYVNPAYERITGNKASDVLGVTLDIRWTPVTPSATFMQHLRQVMESGETDELTLQLLTHNGLTIYHSVRIAAERDASGKIIGALSTSRDITELMETQQALLDSEQRYRQIFDNTQESLFLLDVLPDGHFCILEVNPRFEETTEYAACDLIGKTIEEAAPKEIAAQLTAIYRRCVEDGRIIQEETELNLGHGMRILHSTLIPVRDKDGEVHRIVGLTRDITERRHSEVAMKRLNRALKTLSNGNEALVRATSEAELLEQMCNVIVNAGGYQLAWIGFANSGGATTAASWAGENTNILKTREQFLQQRINPDDPINEATRTGEVRIVRNADQVSIDDIPPETHPCLGFNACLALPLKLDGDEPGLLAIYSTDSAAFDGDELRLLTELAEDLAYGIHAMRVRIDRERFVARLQESMESAIQALASTVELRDPYTAGHQRRVAELATAVTKELGWSEERIQVIYLAGLVHDIGKISIPAEILSKPGSLSEAEFTLVRTHAEAGHDILKTIEFPWPIAEIVRQHHERLNGSGYPRGLHKDDILMEARVLAVCDVVEAMTTHRPYRPGLGVEAALEEIQHGRHELYDTDVVDSCLKVIRELGFRFQ